MNYLDEDLIRANVARFVAETGHGAVAKLAEASNKTPETVRNFRKGGQPSMSTLRSIADGLGALGWRLADQESIQAETVSALNIVAHEVEGLLMVLRSEELTEEQKTRRLTAFVREYHRDLVEAGGKSTK